MRLANVTARALIARVRVLRDVLRESLIQPTRNAVGVKAMKNEVNNLVSQKIIAEFILRISLNKKTAGRMNSTAPRL